MKCPLCGKYMRSLLQVAKLIDGEYIPLRNWVAHWSCLNCGYSEDIFETDSTGWARKALETDE